MAAATHKGVVISHRCGIATVCCYVPSLFCALPKRKQTKTRGVYILKQRNKARLISSMSNIHSASFLFNTPNGLSLSSV